MATGREPSGTARRQDSVLEGIADQPRVIWINGSFGVGKSSVAEELVRSWPQALIFDPELLGRYLRWALPDELQCADFQDIPLWRDLTVQTALGMLRQYGRPLIVPMTLVVPKYFEEIIGGLEQAGVPVRHFALRAEKETILARTRGRPESTHWTTEQVGRCVAALENPMVRPL